MPAGPWRASSDRLDRPDTRQYGPDEQVFALWRELAAKRNSAMVRSRSGTCSTPGTRLDQDRRLPRWTWNQPAPPRTLLLAAAAAALRRLGQPRRAAAAPAVHGGRDHCRNWDWVAGALATGLARHRARPARPRRQPVVARRQLLDGRLRLRPRPAHPSAGAGAGDDRRPLARRQRRPALRRHLPRAVAAARRDRGPRAGAGRDGRRAPAADRRAHATRGSTSSARSPAACRGATPRSRTPSAACRRQTRTCRRSRRAT